MDSPPGSEDLFIQDFLKELEKIERGVQNDPPSEDPNTAPLESEEYNVEKERKDLELQDFRHKVKARRIYGYLAFALVLIWLAVVLATVWLSALEVKFASKGWTVESIKFDVSDAVLIALVTTTTINLLGLLVIVFNHLFPSSKS